MSNTAQKPGRPLGVTLAIIVSVIMYSLLPLVTVILVFMTERRLSEGVAELGASASGGDLLGGYTEAQLIFQVILSIVFFVIAVIAWRGNQGYMRFVLMGSVILLTLINIGLILIFKLAEDDESLVGQTGGSQDILEILQSGRIVLLIIVPLYVLWYLNRGPARAFYRGYYLERPSEEKAE